MRHDQIESFYSTQCFMQSNDYEQRLYKVRRTRLHLQLITAID